MSYFTKEALEKFQAMCAEGIDFGEGEAYDFAMCLMSNGDVYGVEPGEKCKAGRPISDEQGKKQKQINSRMSKLKAAFVKKIGREMTTKEMKKLQNMLASAGGVGVPIPAGQSAEDVLQRLIPKGEKVHTPVRTA
jgi:hypothetical protein